MDFLISIIISAPAILIALTVHEFSHAWVAYKLGDYTAKAEGRLSLNPLVHLDPIGTIVLFLFRFGWAKPVPIAEYNFANPPLGTTLTSLAGPLSNFILAIVGTMVFHLIDTDHLLINSLVIYFVFINIALMCFNLLPIPPLDGHKIIRGLLPPQIRFYWEQMEIYSIYIFIPVVIFLIYTNVLFTVIDAIVVNLIPTYQFFL